MTDKTERRSPIHRLLESRGAQWERIGSSTLAMRFAAPETEATAWQSLAVCDLSVLSKCGFKGRGAEAWLRRQGVSIPEAVYQTQRLGGDGLVARLGATDFFLEGGARAAIPQPTGDEAEVYVVQRHDATFVLTGARARTVLAQTCSIDFASAALGRMILTRVAGMNCMVLPGERRGVPTYRLWVDYTYGVAMWETLVELSEVVVGVESMLSDGGLL